MNASTASIYRHTLAAPMDEATGELGGHEQISANRRAPETWNWTVNLAKEWEAVFFAHQAAAHAQDRSAHLARLQPRAGQRLRGPLPSCPRLGLGGTQGNGRQLVSWIHETDYARALEFLIGREEIEGPVNLAAPYPLPNREFMAALREAWEMPNGLPAPPRSAGARPGHVPPRCTETELCRFKSRYVVPGALCSTCRLRMFNFPRTWPEAAEDLCAAQWRNRED